MYLQSPCKSLSLLPHICAISFMLAASSVSLFLTASIASAQDRPQPTESWTDNTGEKTVTAEFVKLEGVQLTLRKADGKEIVIPLSRLDDKSRLKARAMAKNGGKTAAKEITDSTDVKIVPDSVTDNTDVKIVPDSVTNSIGMKLVLIPAGTFTMGSPKNEVGRNYNEPPHEVTISKSYYIGVYEVTQGEYQKVMGNNPSQFNGAKNPVETVNWDDAVSFCKKLSEMPEEKAAGRLYRLPTEAEWEYACRAGSKTAYSFGDTAETLGEFAWFGESRKGKTHPVGEKKPNRWGLYDMHGNVFELCQDWYADYPPDASTDPQGPNGGTNRAFRGGSWYSDAGNCRSASRSMNYPSNHFHFIGFRVALSPSVKEPEADQLALLFSSLLQTSDSFRQSPVNNFASLR